MSENKRDARKTKVTERMHRFVESREHPCPFAVEAEREGNVQYANISENSPGVTIRQAVKEFLINNKKALVLLFPESLHKVSLGVVMQRAVDYFTEAGVAMIETYNPDTSRAEIRAYAEKELKSVMLDPEAEIIPHIGHPDKGAVYSIFMGQYERPHPRWAPHPMLVLTWESDVEAAKQTKPLVLQSIRQRVFNEFGEEYDANTLALPQRPKK